jgi:beta-mannanase
MSPYHDPENAYPGDDYVYWVGIDGYNWRQGARHRAGTSAFTTCVQARYMQGRGFGLARFATRYARVGSAAR